MSETRIKEIGQEIFSRSSDFEMNLFDRKFWSGKIMDWSMQNPAFKTEMFRFVDVLPSLRDADQVAEHIRQYFFRPGLEIPTVIRGGLGLATSNALTSKIAASAIRKNVTSMATTFITGESVEEARKNLRRIWDQGLAFTVDILGEAAVSESEALSYQKRYLDLIQGLALEMKAWKAQPHLESTPWGELPRANVSVKCSSLYSQMDPMALRSSVDATKERLRPLLQAALENGVFLNLDMEQNDFREILLTVAEEIFCEPEFMESAQWGLVIQAYLKSSEEDLERVIRLAEQRAAPLTVRLVKGAYWDYEVALAENRGWPIPVFTDKAQTDAQYEKLAARLLEAYPKVIAALGSHNVRNLAAALEKAERQGLPKNAFEIQMLYGMADSFKKALVGMGYRVREYAPVGELLPGMAYLVRRLLENTSNEGFLRARFVEGAAIDDLLKSPLEKIAAVTPKESSGFENESLCHFAVPSEGAVLPVALERVRAQLPLRVPVEVKGEELWEGLESLEQCNPSSLSEKISTQVLATAVHVDAAVSSARTSEWMRFTVAERTRIVRAAAQKMRERKAELTALMVLETGKNYRESDADVAEAIDFCEYYAQEMERLAPVRSCSNVSGETNEFYYQPRGVAVAIAPWNFPLAILCGMTVGPLVAGNPVLMKPAEQSPAIAYELYRILREAGVPATALHFLPGRGEVVGAAMIEHPQVHIVSFTGSRAVGLKILEEANRVRPGQKHLKRVVAEMGGKNAIIIDDDADLDEAVLGVLHSAFGFQGQKCSAASRVIVLEPCYEKFKSRLVEAVGSLKMGPAEDPSCKVGPVIDAEAQGRLLSVIERHRPAVIAQLEDREGWAQRGYFVPPTVFESEDFQSELGQTEFFGPLVTIFCVKDLDEAIRALNDVDYALTGGIYSRAPRNIERARALCEVGNFYINRGITGALVGRQPFGGFKLSGVGAKAGGPDYLLQFLEPRSVCENTMRRGFAPEEGE